MIPDGHSDAAKLNSSARKISCHGRSKSSVIALPNLLLRRLMSERI